jgi:hypothetical protein
MSRRSIAIIAAMTLVVVLVGAGVVYAYDASREDRIAEGMRIGGVEVGGLSADQANAKLRVQLVQASSSTRPSTRAAGAASSAARGATSPARSSIGRSRRRSSTPRRPCSAWSIASA